MEKCAGMQRSFRSTICTIGAYRMEPDEKKRVEKTDHWHCGSRKCGAESCRSRQTFRHARTAQRPSPRSGGRELEVLFAGADRSEVHMSELPVTPISRMPSSA